MSEFAQPFIDGIMKIVSQPGHDSMTKTLLGTDGRAILELMGVDELIKLYEMLK